MIITSHETLQNLIINSSENDKESLRKIRSDEVMEATSNGRKSTKKIIEIR